MGKNKNKTQNRNNNSNQGNGSSKPAKKPGLFAKLRAIPARHPKITKGIRITTKVVGTGLAAIGGAGLAMAINERRTKTGAAVNLPEMPVIPDPVPGPVDNTTED